MNARQRCLRVDDYLEHMEDASRLAVAYVEGMDRQTFLEDK